MSLTALRPLKEKREKESVVPLLTLNAALQECPEASIGAQSNGAGRYGIYIHRTVYVTPLL